MVVIPHIDEIGRRRGAAVLYLEFHLHQDSKSYHFQQDPERERVLAWLEHETIGWEPCGPIASETRMEAYRGQVVLDVPYDIHQESYRKLCAMFEYPDGSMRLPTVRFCVLPLDYALRNRHHDDAGFWEDWAEGFCDVNVPDAVLHMDDQQREAEFETIARQLANDSHKID